MKGVLRVLSKNGDDETEWHNEKTAVKAKAVFDDLVIDKKYAAFSKVEDGHERIKEFDPNADEIIIVRPLVGG